MELWQAGLLADMRREAEVAGGEALESVFFGGGTPSLMPPRLVESLLEEVERLWGFATDVEITLEANPSSVEAANFAALAAAGVNRVSLGIQALDNETLRFFGRLHDVAEGYAALDAAQQNFGRVSFDLIYARPDQTIKAWREELETALALGTGHLSLYQLTVEPGTRFATMLRDGALQPLDEDACADMFAMTREMTASAGLPAYEISNHAKPGEESRHNLTYWRYRDYCGIGPGAHGRRGSVATIRHRKPENWLAAIQGKDDGIAEMRNLSMREQASEALLMGLRLAEGIDLGALSARFGLPESELCDTGKLEFYLQKELLWRDGSHLGVSGGGMLLLDGLLGELVPQSLVTA